MRAFLAEATPMNAYACIEVAPMQIRDRVVEFRRRRRARSRHPHAASRMARVRFAILVVVVFGAHVVAAYIHDPVNFKSEYCIECGATRYAEHTRAGTAISTDTSASQRDLIASNHEHRWVLDGMGDDNVLACGFERPPNRFVRWFNDTEEFRAFVRSRVGSGRVARETLARVVALDGLEGDTPEAVVALSLLDEFPGELD
jgi:hypothetical protein